MNREAAETFLKAWDSGQETFSIQSSGSTGAPKTLHLERRWMIWSAMRTAEYLKPRGGESLFCCIPVNRVGGMMMLVRARVWGMNVLVHEASSNPLIEPVDADIISLTPFQLHHIYTSPKSLNHLMRFREVLIGGGELPPALEKALQAVNPLTRIRHSYGMSETYSHVALRDVNGTERSEWFSPLHEININKTQDGCAVIMAPFCPDGMQTNDVIEVHTDGRFRVLGRSDFVINSGGVKLQPEQIEKAIYEKLPPTARFVISSIRDQALGQKLVLVCEDSRLFDGMELGFLREINAYAVPKAIIEIDAIPVNAGGKTDRLKTREMINS